MADSSEEISELLDRLTEEELRFIRDLLKDLLVGR
jgi:hypothetical protein